MQGAIFQRFVEESPISVMVRGLMEGVFAPEKINSYFETNAQARYTRELLFSSLVDLMRQGLMWNIPIDQRHLSCKSSTVKCQSAVYDKLNGVEPKVSAVIVRETAVYLVYLRAALD